MGTFPFRAYAKINLGLLVLEKRPDGYHNIETVFHRVNLFDTISFSPSPRLTVESSSRAVPGNEGNICFKAAKSLQEHLGLRSGVCISIDKIIPVGAGLGGGSSDAAGVLLHLPGYWGVTVDNDELLKMALDLGSDVPYFLRPGSARAEGRGEILNYFDLDVPYTILLCDPGIHISTAWAYQHVQPRRRSLDLKSLLECGMKDARHLAELTNDFEETVFLAHPTVGGVKQVMLDHGAVFSSLSGSGSTVYGLFDDEEKVRGASTALTTTGFKTFRTSPHFRPDVGADKDRFAGSQSR